MRLRDDDGDDDNDEVDDYDDDGVDDDDVDDATMIPSREHLNGHSTLAILFNVYRQGGSSTHRDGLNDLQILERKNKKMPLKNQAILVANTITTLRSKSK